MNTVKKNILIMVAFAAIGACSEPIDYGRNIHPYSKKTDFHLEAEVLAAPLHYQNALNLEVNEASSCNLAKSVFVAIFGVKNIQHEQGGFKISYGTMNLLIPDSGCYLVGRFNGRGMHDAGRLTIDATIKIDYGAGTFKADGGDLGLTIIGTSTQDKMMRYSIIIDGYLENRLPVVN